MSLIAASSPKRRPKLELRSEKLHGQEVMVLGLCRVLGLGFRV